jgi:hypothetical protein
MIIAAVKMIEGMKSPELISMIFTYQVFHKIASRNDLKAPEINSHLQDGNIKSVKRRNNIF